MDFNLLFYMLDCIYDFEKMAPYDATFVPNLSSKTEESSKMEEPIPPTPIDELAPSSSNQLQPPSSRESYFQNHHGPRPNAPYSYEHHDPQGGPPMGHRSGRNPSPDPAPPPVPVSRQYIICIICTVITPCTKPVWTPLNVGAFSAYINRAIMMIMRLGPSTLDTLSHTHLALWKVPIE